jgi:hypothetical protein
MVRAMGRRKLIALDNSALHRLWDAATSAVVVHQAAAVREILADIETGRHGFLMTWALWWEIDRTSDAERRSRALAALPEHDAFAGKPASPINCSRLAWRTD